MSTRVDINASPSISDDESWKKHYNFVKKKREEYKGPFEKAAQISGNYGRNYSFATPNSRQHLSFIANDKIYKFCSLNKTYKEEISTSFVVKAEGTNTAALAYHQNTNTYIVTHDNTKITRIDMNKNRTKMCYTRRHKLDKALMFMHEGEVNIIAGQYSEDHLLYQPRNNRLIKSCTVPDLLCSWQYMSCCRLGMGRKIKCKYVTIIYYFHFFFFVIIES